jgi:hypothetical protein
MGKIFYVVQGAVACGFQQTHVFVCLEGERVFQSKNKGTARLAAKGSYERGTGKIL